MEKIELPEYIRHKGYGHGENLKVFRLYVPLSKRDGRYNMCYGNKIQTIFDVKDKYRNEAIRKMAKQLKKDKDWWQVKKSEWDKENI